MVERTLDAFGRLDIGFNNAGIGRAGSFIADEDEAAWQRVVAVNLTGVFLSMKYEIPAMLDGSGGAIINASSVGGLIASPGQAAYQASKHGVLGLTKAAALEYAPQRIRVNAICPAVTRTEIVARWFATPGVERQVTNAVPVGRIAEPEEIARAVLFLASDDCQYMTGHALVADGGFIAQ